MGLSSFFGWSVQSSVSEELPEIFPISIAQADFIKTDIINIYSKILTDVVARTHGLSDEQSALLWDNCVKSSSQDGLITMLAKAMADKQDLFLVLDAGVLRQATGEERTKIEEDYKKTAKSSVGIFISFKNYSRSDMVKLYSGLEYCTVSALHKSANLSKAIQIKMSDMRASVSLTDSDQVKTQAKAMATSLAKGRDILMDAKDSVETAVPNLTAAQESIKFIDQKRSFYLGLPEAYINGQQTGGLSTTGEGDARAVERGLKNYYFSIILPVLTALFGAKITYKSQDFRQIEGSMEVLKTFSATGEEIVSLENKTMIMNQLLDLPADAKGDEPKAPPVVVAAPGTPTQGAEVV